MTNRDWLIHCLKMVAPDTTLINCVDFVNTLDAYLVDKFQISNVPPKRKPLTDEEMYALARQVGFDSELMKSNHDRGMPSMAETFARAIEAAHGIKS